jgi:hypothetical protein
MHPLTEYPHTAAFGVTRAVPVNTQMIAFENGQLNRRKNPQWASVKGTPMDASRSGAAGTRLAALGQASRSVPVTCAVSGRWSAKILNERKLSVTPCHSGENAPRGRASSPSPAGVNGCGQASGPSQSPGFGPPIYACNS